MDSLQVPVLAGRLSPLAGLPQDFVELLASLASQHHKSVYSKSKFGHQGYPMIYIPLSLHSPDHYTQLIMRQTSLSSSWFLNRHGPPSPSQFYMGPGGSSVAEELLGLQQELFAAMSQELDRSFTPHLPPLQALTLGSRLKTSNSHPINVSHMIPPKLMPLITSNALLMHHDGSPTILNILPDFTLDRLIFHEEAQKHPLSMTLPAVPLVPPVPLLNRASVSEATQTKARKEPLDLSSSNSFPPTPTLSLAFSLSVHSSPTVQCFDPDSTVPLVGSTNILLHDILPHVVSKSHGVVLKPFSITASPPGIPPIPTPPEDYFSIARPAHITLGNMLLSSCPGKKVRLHGPLRGRPSICRDLETDLERIKDYGVGCIVCCLDDTELEFLGVSWAEYAATAQRLGVDLLRMPTPEGLAPLGHSPAELDVQLTRLIETYTLRNISVLTHCRGGVGRAGVIACCWLLKLGLCGWAGDCESRDEAAELVRRVIGVVRTRRSLKAIETFEQARFLVEFVLYLGGNRGARR